MHVPDQPAEWVEVFASPSAADCRERALVLRTQGIPFTRQQAGRLHVVLVPRAYEEPALRELGSYERENVDWPPRQPAPTRRPGAEAGTAGYALVLGALWFLSQADVLGLGWRDAGAAVAADIRSGEPWRAVTALTLHSGPVHLLSNLIFGAFFGLLVTWSHGPGLAWLAILVAGSAGNLANAWVQDPAHVSIGASTAVFGAVGLLAGSEWRRRHLLRERRLRVAAPIVIGLLVLALHGVPQDPTGIDVMAHVLGLGFGVAIGPFLPHLAEVGASRRVQAALGSAAVLAVAAAWTVALARGV